jgi:hypothetical protein
MCPEGALLRVQPEVGHLPARLCETPLPAIVHGLQARLLPGDFSEKNLK